jgi:glutathione S-transferase
MGFVVYGPAYSTYTRSVRLAFTEKGATYQLVEVDILKGEGGQPGYRARQPFGKVPALEHDDFQLYETGAILRYVDEVVPGPSLVPGDARGRARMTQIMGIIDAYAYGCIIQKLFWQRALVPMLGGQPDEKVVEEALPRVSLCLSELERIMGGDRWLAGSALSLADLMLGPIMAYLGMTPECATLLAERQGLARWWQAMAARPSMAATAPKLG